jgi:hypothetical protein
MTSPEFGSLYYTDCLPGQGLRGGAGFGFQAVSVGVGQAAMGVVQRSALYEPPVSWIREQRPVADYPASLAHVYEDLYVTARGIYLGAEANGVREGNQFTHAVTTSDPESYGQVRPAQLWDAPWWVEKPAPSTKCEPVPAEPEAGPWGVDAVREWVLGQPDAGEWLTAVHSALDRVHDADRRRVLFVATDPAAVLGWLAAGTLLLPQERALRVGFRVFAANPRQSNHDVLAVHPDWAGAQASPDRDGEFVVFDLTMGRHTPVEPTESALHWVPRFLRAGPDDVYDVVDAVELATQFTRQRQPDEDPRASAADRLASGVVLLGERPDEPIGPEVLAEWLVAQPEVPPEFVAEPLVAALLDCRVDLDGLRAMDRAAHRHGVGEPLLARVRLALLHAEIDELADGRTPGEDMDLAPYRWPGPDRDEATRLVERAADQVAPELMDALLCLAVDFDTAPDARHFAQGATRFTRWWLEHPAASVHPARWHDAAALTGRLRAELANRCRPTMPDRVTTDIRHHWWPILLPHITDPAVEPDSTVTAAAMAGGDAATRRKTIEWVGTTVGQQDPAVRAEIVWRALYRYTAPEMPELLGLLRQFPWGGGSKSFAANVFAVLDEAMAGQVSEAQLDALREFGDHGLIPELPWLRGIGEQDRMLCGWLDGVAKGHVTDPEMFTRISGRVLYARRAAVLTALLDQVSLSVANRAVESGATELIGLLANQLPIVWADGANTTRRRLAAVALAYLTAYAELSADMVAVRIEKLLRSWLLQAESGETQRVGRLIADVDAEAGRKWRDFADKQRERGKLAGQDRPPRNVRETDEQDARGRARIWPPRGRRNKEG